MTDNEKIIPEYSSDAVIDALIRAKDERGLTVSEIAEASGVPESTVKRVFSRTTKDPTFETVSRLARGLGIDLTTLSETSIIPAPAPAAPAKTAEEKLCEVYEKQMHFQRLLIVILLGVIIALLAFLIWVLIYDLTHSDRGWYQQAYNVWEGMKAAVHTFFTA